jgi:hypothetical protein
MPAMERYVTRLNELMQQAAFDPNIARGLGEDPNFSRQLFAAQLHRELVRLKLAFWCSAIVILAGVVGLDLLFRLH